MPDPQSLPGFRHFLSIQRGLESLVIFAVCLVCLGWELAAEPHFVDESAYISQSFYSDLFLSGRWNDPAWLDYAGYDLPPLPKYGIGMSLASSGYRRPNLGDAHAWYRNTNRRFVDSPALAVARRPSLLLGAVGCVAMFWLGGITQNFKTGRLAAFLLLINPLYRMHSRRAMSDIFAESFLLLALVFGAMVWTRTWRRQAVGRSWLLVLGAGGMVGLATVSKLNGVLGGLVLAGWVGLAVVSRDLTPRSKWFLISALLVAAVTAFATFVALNPYLTAHPPEPVAPEYAQEAAKSFLARTRAVYDHRANVSRIGMQSFPRDALPTLWDRMTAVAIQGFGRFGPLGPRGGTDSTLRFDWRQDRGAIVWLPLVMGGLIVLCREGWGQSRHQQPARSWLVVAYFGVVFVVVTPFIPLAWDRYFLSIQAPSCLVVASLVVGLIDRWQQRGRASGGQL